VYKSDTEIITASTYDFTNATAGSALDIYVLHDNGKKSSTVKYSVLATGHAPTIEKLSADEFRVGQSHSNVEVVGTGFTTNSELYMGTKKLTVSYGGPTKLTISSLNLSNDPGGVYNLQVKDGTKVSNYYPLFARLPDAPVLDYTSPGSREYGYGTSTYLYIYGSNMCPTSGTSTLCTTNPTIKVEGPGKKDYSGNYSASTRRSTYIYGTLTLTGLPVGDFLFTLGFGSVVSNPAVFSLTPPPPPTITGDNAPYRGDTRTVQLKGTNFATGDEVVVNNNVFGKKPTRNVSKTSLDFDLDLSNAYAGKIDIYVQRCDPTSTNCSKVIKSNTWQLTVNEIPSCTLASNCTAGVSANEGCTSYKGAQTCRPKCTTDAQCKAMLAAPTTATCTGGFCK
jgi:hypothetical protein